MSVIELLRSDPEFIRNLKIDFPRIVNAEIKNDKLCIQYYAVDAIEAWIDDYSRLDTLLKTGSNSKDKYYTFKFINSL
jgi:hypothetical protein